MLFNSVDFLIFFPIITLFYFIIPKKLRYIWLLAASYYFYMCWNAKYALLLVASTVTTWLAGWMVHYAKRALGKKLAIAGCVMVNVGILFYFKYFNFFLDTCYLLSQNYDIEFALKPVDVLLPVGISFYTFQALGYIVDVYRERITPEKNPLRYALFVSFFPQLVAGPIERSENLLKQVREIHKIKLWNYDRVASGLTLMVWGLFVKMVIADRVAILVDKVFENYMKHGSVALIIAALGFALQIYCDFMGYSTIAVGAAKVMGFELMENFDTPYFAVSVGDFWKRWHISLSTWFRDYVYIPLGGNRCSKIRKYFNLLVTMGISGLWHGADWSYFVWGILHGVYQVIGDMTKPIRRKLCDVFHVKTKSFSYTFGQMLITFVLVDIAWVFFRARSVTDAVAFIKRIFEEWDPWFLINGEIFTLGLERLEFNILIVATMILFVVDVLRYTKKQTVEKFLQEQCVWFRWGVIIFLILAVMVFGIYGIDFESSQFIYFQF